MNDTDNHPLYRMDSNIKFLYALSDMLVCKDKNTDLNEETLESLAEQLYRLAEELHEDMQGLRRNPRAESAATEGTDHD